MSHYEVLGVLPSASQDEIRVAYRMRAREVHPDTAAGRRNDASIQMAHIAEAWRVLSDATLRKAYDSELTAPWKHSPRRWCVYVLSLCLPNGL